MPTDPPTLPRRPRSTPAVPTRGPIAQAVEIVSHDTQVELVMPRFTDESMTNVRGTPEAEQLGAGPTVAGSMEPGDRIGRYRIGNRLGQGTFGIVFEALDTHLDRLVAIKVLAPSHAIDPRIVRRFVQEGRAAARVCHPGIVTVFDCGEDRGTAYIAMELLQGESLANRLGRSGALAPDDAMEIARQVAAALHAAHEMGVIHRDLKPDNIFLVPDPATASGERVKVLDFGLAKLRQLRADAGGDHTARNQAFGTPRYMAPEQARSAGDVDRRADVYALGCILYELVCGDAPFDGELLALFEQHQRVRAPRARQLAPAIPHALDVLIARMLEKVPAARPATMAIVQRELRAAGALAPGVAATILPCSASQVLAMPLAALRALPSATSSPPSPPPAVFGPGSAEIALPEPRFAVALPILPPPASRVRRIGLYAAAAAVLVTAVALVTTIALGSAAPPATAGALTPAAVVSP